MAKTLRKYATLRELALDQALDPLDVRLYVLLQTEPHDDPDYRWPTQTALAGRLGRSRQRINAALGRLERRGYLHRTIQGQSRGYRFARLSYERG